MRGEAGGEEILGLRLEERREVHFVTGRRLLILLEIILLLLQVAGFSRAGCNNGPGLLQRPATRYAKMSMPSRVRKRRTSSGRSAPVINSLLPPASTSQPGTLTTNRRVDTRG